MIPAVHALETLPAEDPREPVFRVLRGNPTAEELAVLTALFTALDATAQEPERAPARTQRQQSRRMRLGMRLRPGWGAWRRSRPTR